MTTQIKAITNNGIAVFANTETIIGTAGDYNIILALDASQKDEQGNPMFLEKEFIIYAVANADPVYLGFAYLDEQNESVIDLTDGAVDDEFFIYDDIVEMVQDQLELAKEYHKYGSIVHGVTLIDTDEGKLQVNICQDAYLDYDPANTDEQSLARATCISPTGRKLKAYWWVTIVDDEGNPLDELGSSLEFAQADSYEWLD